MIFRIYATWVYVSDIDYSLYFYQHKIRLTPKDRSENDWIEFNTGETAFAILKRSTEKRKITPQKTRIMFETDNIESDWQRLINSGVKLIGDIRYEPYGKLLTFEDPDGHWLELFEGNK